MLQHKKHKGCCSWLNPKCKIETLHSKTGARVTATTRNGLFGRVEHIPGATVEHNKFCVSVHFRNCSPESYEHVVTAVKDTLHDHSDLRASRGRKVLEIQPQVYSPPPPASFPMLVMCINKSFVCWSSVGPQDTRQTYMHTATTLPVLLVICCLTAAVDTV